MRSRVLSDASWTLLILSKLKGVGNSTLKKYARTPNLTTASWDELIVLDSYISRRYKPIDFEEAEQRAHEEVEHCAAEQIYILSELDPDYPALFRYTKDSPSIIYLKGNRKISKLSVTIIGTREPTEHGEITCRRITEYYASRKWSIVSGLAIGTDSLAHQAALDCGAMTVAVLAHGLDTVAPKRNKSLAEKILESGGSLLSEYPYGTPVFKSNYVKRDRLQAALGLGVILIQTGIKGGSLHASRASLEYGRVLAYPYPTKKDINDGAEKIQGVLKIAHSEDKDRMGYLECGFSDLRNIYQIKSKADYPYLENFMIENMGKIANNHSKLIDL